MFLYRHYILKNVPIICEQSKKLYKILQPLLKPIDTCKYKAIDVKIKNRIHQIECKYVLQNVLVFLSFVSQKSRFSGLYALKEYRLTPRAYFMFIIRHLLPIRKD